MTKSFESITRRDALKGAATGVIATGFLTSQAAMAQEVYDAIVIGTGFGGTIATLALSQEGKKTLVLERGTFWMTPETLGMPTKPGNPTRDWAEGKNVRVQYWPRPDHALGIIDLFANRRHNGNPYGLHDYRIFRRAHILTASGVGGGSLIYSNVNLPARPDVLERIGLKGIDYKRALRFMEQYRGATSKVVTKVPLPPGVTVEQLASKLLPAKDYLLLDRSRHLRDAAAVVSRDLGIEMPWSALDLSIIESESADADKFHTFCERQGRCMLGCLPQARHTLNKTLYNWVFSQNPAVTLSSESEVRTIRRVSDGYEVTYLDRRGPNNSAGQPRIAHSKQVFLAAGVLGTTEILLRSRRDADLALSDQIGRGFSTNGDFGALAVGTKMMSGGKPVLDSKGNPAKASVFPTRGPINTCDIRFKIDGRHYTIEESGIPSMFTRIVRTGLNDRKKLLALVDPVAFVGGENSSSISGFFLRFEPGSSIGKSVTPARIITRLRPN